MFDMVAKVLGVIFSGWKDTLVGVKTNRARNMPGWHAGLLIFVIRSTGPNFIRVRDGAHQFDLFMANVYDRLL